MINLSLTLLAAVSLTAGPDPAATNEAAVLRDMRADVKALRLKVGYPGKFLEVPADVKGVRQQRYVRLPIDPKRSGMLYDLGEENVGYIEAMSEKCPELYLGESRAEAMNENPADFEQTNLMVRVKGNYWRTPLPVAVRYFRFKGQQPARVRFTEELADVTDRCAPTWAMSERERKLRDVGLRTLRLCMREFLLDGVKRDRLPWSGDLTVSLMANAMSYRDADIVRRTLTVLDSAGFEAGDVNGIIDYSLWLVISHEVYQRYFSDREFLEAKYSRIAARLESFAARSRPDGLLDDGGKEGEKVWLFIDWTPDARSTVALNAIYYGALHAGARLAKRMGRTDDAERWNRRARQVRIALRRDAWDYDRGLFRRDLGTDGSKRAVYTRHPNIYAAYFGLLDDEGLKTVGEALAGDQLPLVGTPYVSSYEVMALIRCGRIADARKLVERIWGGMLDLGATTFWEGYDPRHKGDEHLVFYGRPYGKSLCHAWGAAPVFLLPMLHEASPRK